jgi:hypothetical protein
LESYRALERRVARGAILSFYTTATIGRSGATAATWQLRSNTGSRVGGTAALNLLQWIRSSQPRRKRHTDPRQGDIMDERQFYIEKQDTKTLQLVCPSCRKEGSYPIRWIVRTKKNELPRGASEEDKKHFAQARSYMVRVDELVACRKCRKRFELTGQSVVLVSSNAAAQGAADYDPETFGNR